ncbi:MAG: phytoene desaturase family protein, partial [Anaerolineae bacterium]
MADKSVIIVGAGMAGLSAGCYARMNGYQTRIFEMHNQPGGLCTSWHRQGFTIDGCIHWLMGTKPGSDMHDIWEELGLIQGLQFVYQPEFSRRIAPDGTVISVFTDPDRLEQHLLEISPEDAEPIREFCGVTRRLMGAPMPVGKAPELQTLLDKVRTLVPMLSYLRDMGKYLRVSLEEFAAGFRHPLLRETFTQVMYPKMPVTFLAVTLASMASRDSGYPIGGSLPMARTVEKRYLSLGGEISYRSRVSRILVENDRAVGVRLEDGSEHRADYVISAADGHATIFDMLEGKYVDEEVRRRYESVPVFPAIINVGLGLGRPFSDVPHTVSGISVPLPEPTKIADREHSRLEAHFYNYDPTLAPAGKTVVNVILESDLAYWQELHQDPEAYRAAKEEVAEKVIAGLEPHFPGLASSVEMRDVATPVTYVRYTGNWKGSFEGWLPTTETANKPISKTLPGLDGFYMIGQWVEYGGGLPPAAYQGRHVAQLLCRRDGKRFQ